MHFNLSGNRKALLAAALLTVSSTAMAAPLPIFTAPANGWILAGAENNTGTGNYFVNPGWGGQQFDAEYLFYKQDGNIVSIGLQSGFDLIDGHVNYGGRNYYAGDLALSFDGSTASYEYAIDFGLLTRDYNPAPSGQLVDAGSGTGIDPAGLYSVTQWNNDIAFPASSPFAMDAGTLLTGLISNMAGSGANGDSGDVSYFRVVSFDVGSLGLGSDLHMHWTMSCGNDVIVGSGSLTTPGIVPAPGALPMLALGLLGLLARGRRRAA